MNPISMVGNAKDALVYMTKVIFVVGSIILAGDAVHDLLYHHGDAVATCNVIGYLPDGREALLCIADMNE